MTVLPDFTVRVAPEILVEPYVTYDRAAIADAKRTTHRPTRAVLLKHNLACAWLSTNGEVEGNSE